MRKFLIALVVILSFNATADGMCPNANIITKIITDVCWDCMLPINIGGYNLGADVPDGASNAKGICNCPDELGIPEFGFPLPMWMPIRISEVVRMPWCSPSLGGIKLQDDITAGLGGPNDSHVQQNDVGFYQYHWYASPLAEMLEMFFIPECSVDGLTDFDLMYLSEIDPTHKNDMLSLVLTVEAVAFATPLAKLWCAADCGLVTAGALTENSWGCAGCDGSLYPLTGNVDENEDPVSATSLITQRVLAGLHRKGLAVKTIGDVAMCSRQYWPTTPRTQYKASLLFPKAEADNSPTQAFFELDENGDVKKDNSGKPVVSSTIEHSNLSCCHYLGESVHKWATPRGGMSIPGKEDYLYLIFRYKDCCVRKSGT
ncbi:MAG: TraU family protein [Methylococcales bacterium]